MTAIGIGIVGGGYMGKAHSVAMHAVGAVFNTHLRPKMEMICARSQSSAEKYRYVASLTAQGVSAAGIASALQLAPAEVEQLMKLSRLKNQDIFFVR